MIPETFRKSVGHRKLFATMEFLSERDPTGPIAKSVIDREVVKRAVDRRRTILEHRAADAIRAYFREERAHVVRAVETGRDAGRALELLEDDLRETYRSVWGDSARSWGRWAAGHLPSQESRRNGGTQKAKAYDFGAPVDAWLRENAGKRITGITESSRKKIAAQIAQGTAAGETLKQIARRIDKFYLEDVIPNRSMVIARTEVGSAVNWSQHWIADDSGVAMEKEWLALNDDRTRDDHAEADGQRVGLDEPFEVGDDLLMYPGDPSGSPEEIINCRCSVLHHVVDEKSKMMAAESGAPSVDEFAAQVVRIENADVVTALAFARGVFGKGDDWVWARRQLMKRVYHLRRAEVEKYSPDQIRDEHGRWTDAGAGSSYSPENALRAEAAREHANGALLRYIGGSRSATNPGEHVKVRGVYGMSEKTGVVYYTVEAQGSRRFTLAATTLRPPKEGEMAAYPAPPKPVTPRPVKPRPPLSGTGIEPGTSPYAFDDTGKMIGRRLEMRTGLKVDLERLKPEPARAAAEEMDRLTKKYPAVMPPRPSTHRQYFLATKMPGVLGRRTWGNEIANSGTSGIRLNSNFFNKGNENPKLALMTSALIGWHPPGCDKLEDVVSHEFGHQLHRHLKLHLETDFSNFMNAYTDVNSATTNSSLLRAVSRYAHHKTSDNEAVAEAFSQIEAKESGRYAGPLRPGAEALRVFLSDMKARGKLS